MRKRQPGRTRHGFGHARGLTLIELMVTLAVIALLLGTGVPAMRTFIDQARLSGTVGTYLHTFNSARYHAMAARRQIALCVLDGMGRCSGQWNDRLTVFFDDNRDGVLATEQDVIDRLETPALREMNVTLRAFGTTRYIALRANGHYRQNGTFRFCPQAGHEGRAIVINVLGRARTEKIDCRKK